MRCRNDLHTIDENDTWRAPNGARCRACYQSTCEKKNGKYDLSEKGKARRKSYAVTERGRARSRRYNHTAKGRARAHNNRQNPRFRLLKKIRVARQKDPHHYRPGYRGDRIDKALDARIREATLRGLREQEVLSADR